MIACPVCLGAGELTTRIGRDPQTERTVRCTNCDHGTVTEKRARRLQHQAPAILESILHDQYGTQAHRAAVL